MFHSLDSFNELTKHRVKGVRPFLLINMNGDLNNTPNLLNVKYYHSYHCPCTLCNVFVQLVRQFILINKKINKLQITN